MKHYKNVQLLPQACITSPAEVSSRGFLHFETFLLHEEFPFQIFLSNPPPLRPPPPLPTRPRRILLVHVEPLIDPIDPSVTRHRVSSCPRRRQSPLVRLGGFSWSLGKDSWDFLGIHGILFSGSGLVFLDTLRVILCRPFLMGPLLLLRILASNVARGGKGRWRRRRYGNRAKRRDLDPPAEARA